MTTLLPSDKMFMYIYIYLYAIMYTCIYITTPHSRSFLKVTLISKEIKFLSHIGGSMWGSVEIHVLNQFFLIYIIDRDQINNKCVYIIINTSCSLFCF